MSTAHLVVISPDSFVLQAVERTALAWGHVSYTARDLAQAQRLLTRVRADLICIDTLLPRAETDRLLRWLERDERRAALPILYLAPPTVQGVPPQFARHFRDDRDGVVSRPVDGRELARELTRLLSATKQQREPALLRVGRLALDGTTQQLFVEDHGAIPLTRTEYRLLRYLMERPNQFIPAEELLERVWGFPPGIGGAEVVRAHVSNVRRKLRQAGEDPYLLRTIPYRGYAVVAESNACQV